MSSSIFLPRQIRGTLALLSGVKFDYPAIYARERKETTWDEMLEPFESFLKIPYWKGAH